MEIDRCRNNKLRCAVLDTNILILMYSQKVDVLSQLHFQGFSEIIIPKSVVEELESIIQSLSGRNRVAAKLALNMIREGKIRVVEAQKKGDNALLEVAERYGCYLITNDSNLRKRAKNRKILVGYIREMNRVELVE
jgi:hypothetical protein